MGSLYVVSDVHGYAGDLRRGLEQASFGDDDELWILGDLMDRGPDGIGTVDLVMSLQREAPDRVHVLMGNHEILALGRHRFPGTRFFDSWVINGGRSSDQRALTDEHVQWLASLPLLGQVGEFLFMHSDSAAYVGWGESVDEVNESVRGALSEPRDFQAHWDVWVKLTSRYHFARSDGAEIAKKMLGLYGGSLIIHGHTIIGTLADVPSEEVTSPLMYAEDRVMDIDGGRYDGGPLLVVRLQ